MVKILVVSIVAACTLIASSEPCLATDISIPDPGLTAALRETLQKPAGALTEEDLLSLKVLDASNRGITDLTGLGAAHNLLNLNLNLNSLTNGSLPLGLASLTNLDLGSNQLDTVTIPPDEQHLQWVALGGNPVITLVVSQPLAAGTLAGQLSGIPNTEISVYTYPLEAQLTRPRFLSGAFHFGLLGPPAAYNVVFSTDLVNWNDLTTVTNTVGAINIVDTTAHTAPARFYKVSLKSP